MKFADRSILAPLTKGGNLPFRRLCVDFGADITMSEMAYARQVMRRSRAELALLRAHASEATFGVQLAAGRVHDAVGASKTAVERGATFVDINAGCPIHDTTRRGMGATLMRRPDALIKMVEAMVKALEVPVTVKLRSGWTEKDTNAIELALKLRDAGVAAVTLHARSREQRYTKAADWGLIAQLVAACPEIPIIGNGDVLTWFEARDRQRESGCAAVMLGRGALTKPWLFREIRDQETWDPSPVDRVGVYLRFTGYLKEHFRDDEKGRERTMRFLPWHLGFFCRYQHLPASEFEARSREHPLIQTRFSPAPPATALEGLLRDSRTGVHEQMAAALWEAADLDAAVAAFERLALELPPPPDDEGVDHREVSVAQG